MRGWRVLARNYRGVGFELDLVVHKERTVSFVEVKYRPRLADGRWELGDFLSPRKRAALRRGAEHFIANHVPDADHFRFDLWLLHAEGVVVTAVDMD